MCGIVGAVAQRNVVPILIEGLRKLEYRGYDSAGIAMLHGAGVSRVRTVGRVAELESRATEARADANTGSIGSRSHLPHSHTNLYSFRHVSCACWGVTWKCEC